MKYRFSKKDPLVQVIKPIVGQSYHVSWSRKHGVVGVCISIDEVNQTVKLQTPKTKIKFKYPVK